MSLPRCLLVTTVAWLVCTFICVGQPPQKAETPAIADVLSPFEQGDPGWRVRMQALAQIAREGDAAAPLLVNALKSESTSSREFAAHALSILGTPQTEQALVRALQDPDRGVRIYAARALSGLGKLRLTDEYRQLLRHASDAWPKAPWMEEYLVAAENPPEFGRPVAKRKLLQEYDLSLMDTARLGQRAPDFELLDRSGKIIRLSDYRGKAVVVLEFANGDG